MGDLHVAVARGDVATLEALLRAGADVEEKNEHDATPLWVAIHVGTAELVELLLRHGAKPTASMVERATTLGEDAMVRTLVQASTADATSRGQMLCWAAWSGTPAAVESLLAAVPDLGARVPGEAGSIGGAALHNARLKTPRSCASARSREHVTRARTSISSEMRVRVSDTSLTSGD